MTKGALGTWIQRLERCGCRVDKPTNDTSPNPKDCSPCGAARSDHHTARRRSHSHKIDAPRPLPPSDQHESSYSMHTDPMITDLKAALFLRGERTTKPSMIHLHPLPPTPLLLLAIGSRETPPSVLYSPKSLRSHAIIRTREGGAQAARASMHHERCVLKTLPLSNVSSPPAISGGPVSRSDADPIPRRETSKAGLDRPGNTGMAHRACRTTSTPLSLQLRQ